HRKIAECAGNAMFRAMFDMIIRVRDKADWQRIRQYYFRHDGARRSYEEHKVILDAIGERDPNAAAAPMQDHLRKVSASLLGEDSPVAWRDRRRRGCKPGDGRLGLRKIFPAPQDRRNAGPCPTVLWCAAQLARRSETGSGR